MSAEDYSSDELRELAEVFRKYGAEDPDDWARSQLEEGIPQLAIFCFSKAIWEGVVGESDPGWIDREIERAKEHPGTPCTQVGAALESMLAKGVDRQLITDLVRVMQYNVLFHVCSLIDGTQDVRLPVNNWALYQVDEESQPVTIINGIHEVLLSMDPTGREMRPRNSQ